MGRFHGGITAQFGPLRVDVPRTAGYYGGVGLAMAFGLIEWPLAIFIGAIPVVKLLGRKDLPWPVTFGVELYEGAAKPVGGDAEGTMELSETPRPLKRTAEDITLDAPPSSPRRTRRAAARK